MPTENQSSNTGLQQIEAAGAAMTQIRTMLGREQRPDQVAAALEACDWSDMPIGNKAIILSAIQALRAPQPHPEPIAWMVGTAIWWTKEEAGRDAAATGLPMIPFGPLTGSVKIEQLREVIKHSDAQIMRQSMRISNQRAQLAELNALMREVLDAFKLEPDGTCINPGREFIRPWAAKVAALSVIAEPQVKS